MVYKKLGILNWSRDNSRSLKPAGVVPTEKNTFLLTIKEMHSRII